MREEYGELWQVNYQHTYLQAGFDTRRKGRHWCLASGDWCWENLKEHPLDIFRYRFKPRSTDPKVSTAKKRNSSAVKKEEEVGNE